MTEFHTRRIGNAGLSNEAMCVAMDHANEEDIVLDTYNVVEELHELITDKRELSKAEKELGDVCKRALDAGVEVLVVCH